MEAEKCACPFAAKADILQRPVNGYAETDAAVLSLIADDRADALVVENDRYAAGAGEQSHTVSNRRRVRDGRLQADHRRSSPRRRAETERDAWKCSNHGVECIAVQNGVISGTEPGPPGQAD